MNNENIEELIENYKLMLSKFVTDNEEIFKDLNFDQKKHALRGALFRVIDETGRKILCESENPSNNESITESIDELKELMTDYIDELIKET